MDAPVIVLGAGVAGLVAARTLSRAGMPVLVLEARQRIGGRILTLHEPGLQSAIEMGAEFVHGKPPQIWRAVEVGSLQAIEIEGENWSFQNGHLQKPERLFQATERVTSGMDEALDQSFDEFLKRQPGTDESRRWATGYVEGFHAARPGEVSVRSLAEIEQAEDAIEGDHSFRLTGGYGALVNWLRSGMAPKSAKLRCGAVVERVAWRRGQVNISATVGGRPQSFAAARAICTLPLGVLAANSVRFEPEPEVLRGALRGVAVGHASRITLRFRRRVWEDRAELRGLGFLFSQEPWMPTWWTLAPSEEPLLVGWTAGPRAEGSPADAESWLEPALATLGKMLGRTSGWLRGELVSRHAHNWSADPFARGAYAYVRVGGLEALRRWGEPVEDTLYFAGEATNAEGYIGTVHGAMASGERAARLILQNAA